MGVNGRQGYFTLGLLLPAYSKLEMPCARTSVILKTELLLLVRKKQLIQNFPDSIEVCQVISNLLLCCYNDSIQMANKHMKRCTASLITGEMQIKSTMRYQFAYPLGWLLLRKKRSFGKDAEIATFGYWLWKCKIVQPLQKTSVPQKTKHTIW